MALPLAGSLLGAGALAALLAAGLAHPSDTASTALVGRPAPALSGDTLTGTAFDLATSRGRPVVVNVWASWCTTCVQEIPAMWAAVAGQSGTGAMAVGIDTRDDAGSARQLLGSIGIDLPSVTDGDGRIAADWGVTGVPETFVVAPNGTITAHAVGTVTAQWLTHALSTAMSTGPAGARP